MERQVILIRSNFLIFNLKNALGGYTAGPKEIVDLLRQRSRPYLFSNTLPPPVVAGAAKALDLICQDTSLPNKVAENTLRFRSKMTKLGFKISVSLIIFILTF